MKLKSTAECQLARNKLIDINNENDRLERA
jgi:hypothetical protein